MNKNKFSVYANLPTEQINKKTIDIDRIPLIKILKKLNEEDKTIPEKISKSLKEIEKGTLIISKTFLNNKTTFFLGAGTSGRLGVIEASELPPSYGVDRKQFVSIIAGGNKAVFKSQEGAEDVYEGGFKAIESKIKKNDTLIAIAASGITPYVQGSLEAAKKIGANTIFLTCNKNSKPKFSDVIIAIDIGPEPINGSTRMKSGTATKLVLNMLTTSAMIISGKVYKNWMVDVKTTSLKLELRAQRIISQILKISPEESLDILKKAKNKVKHAIVMKKLNIDFKKADKLLKENKGFLRKIIEG